MLSKMDIRFFGRSPSLRLNCGLFNLARAARMDAAAGGCGGGFSESYGLSDLWPESPLLMGLTSSQIPHGEPPALQSNILVYRAVSVCESRLPPILNSFVLFRYNQPSTLCSHSNIYQRLESSWNDKLLHVWTAHYSSRAARHTDRSNDVSEGSVTACNAHS